MKRLFYIVAIFFYSCHSPRDCKAIDNSYAGNAIIFFQKSESGYSYQVMILPTCETSDELLRKVHKNFGDINLGKGLAFIMDLQQTDFKNIQRNSTKIALTNKADMVQNLRSVYYCTARVELINIVKNIQSLAVNRESPFKRHFVFEKRGEITITFDACSKVGIKAINFLFE